MSVAVVTDSTAYLTDEQYEELNVYKIPLSCVFGKEVYKEEVDITVEDFFLKVRESDKLPTSSQPTVGDFTELYEKLAESYDEVISIHLSSKISGTFQNALSVAQSMNEITIHPYDSGISASGQAAFVIAAAKMAKEGKSLAEIIDVMDQLKDKSDALFVVDDVTNLVKGGRLSKASGGMATLLKIKPVLTFEEGKIIPFDKIRTKKKALNRIEEVFGETVEKADYPIHATVVHAFSEEEGKALTKRLEEKFPQVRFDQSFIGPVIGVHVGEGCLGFTWTIDFEKL